MDSKLKSLAEALKPLKITYQKKLPSRLAEIDLAWSKLLSEHAVQHDFEVFYGSIHKLAGTGETFGFSEISRIAKLLQNQIMNVLNNDLCWSDEDRKRTEQLFCELKSEIQCSISKDAD